MTNTLQQLRDGIVVPCQGAESGPLQLTQHIAARLHAAGKAVRIDDLVEPPQTLSQPSFLVTRP